jgi:hypothetical protein
MSSENQQVRCTAYPPSRPFKPILLPLVVRGWQARLRNNTVRLSNTDREKKMNKPNDQFIGHILRKSTQQIMQLLIALIHYMMQLSLPALLLACLACALLLSIMPFILILFIGFLACKLLVLSIGTATKTASDTKQGR